MVCASLSLTSAIVDSQRCRLQANSTRSWAPASRPGAPSGSTSVFPADITGAITDEKKTVCQLCLVLRPRQINPRPFSSEIVKHKLVVDTTADLLAKDWSLRVWMHMLEIAEPWFRLPYRIYFTDTVIPAKYCSTRAAIEKQLATVENCLA